MSAVSPANSGFSYLSQLLSSTGSSTVTSALSSPGVQSALQNASPTDVVQLSAQALQLQAVDGLFASSDLSSTGASPESLLFQALSSSLTQATNTGSTIGSSGSGTTQSSSTASALSSNATDALALQQAYDLFGNPSSSGSSLSFLG